MMLSDGSTEKHGANLIAESIIALVDDEGNMYAMMEEIIDHKRNGDAINKQQAMIETRSGARMKITTRGWELLVAWKDGTQSWVRLADMKESYPMETAQYAENNALLDKPAFAWWARKVLQRKKRLLSKLKSKTKYWLKTHQYGIRVPRTIKEALQIDKETGSDHWRRAIEKEVGGIAVSFEVCEDGQGRVGDKKITCHWIFSVKLDLTRKARLVADGHKVPESAKENTYSTVPSRDSIRLFFLIAALNDLEVWAADIKNAYLTAPIKEKYYIVVTPDLGLDEEWDGKPCKVVRALYGLPVAGASFRAYLAKHLGELGYVPSKAD